MWSHFTPPFFRVTLFLEDVTRSKGSGKGRREKYGILEETNIGRRYYAHTPSTHRYALNALKHTLGTHS